MQFLTIASLLFTSLVASSMALPARLAYYQQQPSFYYQSRAAPQRLMYMQYVQQPSVARTSGRLTNAAAAFVAGDSVATGTYVKDDEQQVAASETVLDNTGANGAQSVAEAYPDEYPQDDGLSYEVPQAAVEDEVPQIAEEETPLAADDEAVPVADAVPEANPEPAVAAAAAPAVPSVPEPASAAVELEDELQNDADDDNDAASDDDDADFAAPSNPRRRPATKASPATPAPAGSFFSVDFGGATGGAVAISNSYSTGSNGSAKSQAVAFGNPEEARLKNAPSRRRH